MSKTKEKGKHPFRVFVSYAMEDTFYAMELINSLNQSPKLRVVTSDKISAGENWSSKFKRKLSESDFFIILLSPTSVNSKWLLFELGAAWGLKKNIVTVTTSPDVINKLPVSLSDYRVIDLDQLRNPIGLNQLIESYEATAA